jgi:hypothetical protein
MAALVGECGIQIDSGSNVNARERFGCFKYRLVEVLALRVFHCASDLALLTADAPLWIDKHCLHASHLLGDTRESNNSPF